MNNQKKMDRVACLMADIEDPCLIMESLELDSEDAKTYLLNECHYLLWDLYLELEAKIK